MLDDPETGLTGEVDDPDTGETGDEEAGAAVVAVTVRVLLIVLESVIVVVKDWLWVWVSTHVLSDVVPLLRPVAVSVHRLVKVVIPVDVVTEGVLEEEVELPKGTELEELLTGEMGKPDDADEDGAVGKTDDTGAVGNPDDVDPTAAPLDEAVPVKLKELYEGQ